MKQVKAEKRAIGIDISKAYFDVGYMEDAVAQHEQFENNKKGFRALKKWLRKRNVRTAHFVMEATGRYGLELAEFLHQQGYAVSIVNPKQIKAYRESYLRRNKTDAADALLISEFCRNRTMPLWQPPAAEVVAIQDMERRIGSLQKIRTMEINRLKSGKLAKAVEKSLKRSIRHLEEEIEQMEKAIRELTTKHTALKAAFQLLTSVQGVGDRTAAILIGEVKDISLVASGSSLAAYVGVTPYIHESGTSVRKRPRMSKVGNARLRAALYYPTLSAMQHNPVIKAFAERLKAKGKPNKVVIIACMRKLLHIIYGVWSSGKPFDPDYEQKRQAVPA